MSVPPPFQHPGPPPARPELPEGVTPPEPPRAPDGLPPLGVPVWAPFAGLLATFLIVLVAGVIVGIVFGIGGADLESGDSDTGISLVLTGIQAFVLVAVAWYSAELLSGRRPTPAAFGLRETRLWPALGMTALAYVGFWVVTIIVVSALGEPDEQQLVQDIQDEQTLVVLIGFGVLSCFLAPLAEEFFFRGFMFRALAERIHPIWAAIVAGGVFGVIHLPGSPATSVLVLSFLGVALCLLLWRTGSLIPCIMLHSLNNSISFSATKELPWWGFLLVIAGSVGTTLAVSLLVARAASPARA